jgi:O-antigen/teichoic acid export membrane protein
VRRGATASALVLVFTQLVSLGQTLVIARLLTPAEVGLFAAGTVLAGLVMTFAEGGLRNAIVQRNDDVEVAAETVFWAGLGTCTLWAVLTVAISPVVAWLFESPAAGMVTAVTAGTIVLHGLTYVPDSLMQRRLDVRQRLIVVPATSLGFAVPAVVCALLGFGVWALVIGSYVSHLAWIGTTWVLAGWRPGRARFSHRVWREMARFAFPLVLSNIVDRGREFLETALVGRYLSPTLARSRWAITDTAASWRRCQGWPSSRSSPTCCCRLSLGSPATACGSARYSCALLACSGAWPVRWPG